MTSSEARNQKAAPRSWSIAKKRHIVELTLREGASIAEIAQAHGIHSNSVSRWRALYRAGKLGARSARPARVPATVPSTALLPVTVAPAMRATRTIAQASPAADERETSILQLTLSSGATLRLQTGPLDVDLVCALLAELRK